MATPDQLTDVKAKAIGQLDKYSAGLTGDGAYGAVALHRLVLVFHGGTCVLAEEV